jgi:hypothetical protein
MRRVKMRSAIGIALPPVVGGAILPAVAGASSGAFDARFPAGVDAGGQVQVSVRVASVPPSTKLRLQELSHRRWVVAINAAPNPDRPRLAGGETLAPGQSLHSPDGHYELAMQATDGNLVVYDGERQRLHRTGLRRARSTPTHRRRLGRPPSGDACACA